MFPKTEFALITAIVLATSYASAHAKPNPNGTYASAIAKTNPRGCVSRATEEGALSAYPAWYVCKP